MRAQPEKDQHFMIDSKILELMSDFAKNKKVLEIGGGTGNLTEYLVKKASKVITIEKDKRFQKELEKTGAEIIIGDAMNIDWPEADVMVSNPPYKLCEHLLYKLLRNDFELIVMTFPKKLFDKFGKTKTGIFYSKMFEIQLLQEIPKKAFSPEPKTETVLLKIKRKPSETLLQKVLEQYDKKLKNALRESFCHFGATKKESEVGISKMDLNQELLEKKLISFTNKDMKEFIDSLEKLR